LLELDILSTQVRADLGFAEPEEELTKAQVASRHEFQLCSREERGRDPLEGVAGSIRVRVLC
jgi:hypothetical protein